MSLHVIFKSDKIIFDILLLLELFKKVFLSHVLFHNYVCKKDQILRQYFTFTT